MLRCYAAVGRSVQCVHTERLHGRRVGLRFEKPYCYGWMENSLVAVIEFRPLGLRVPVQFTAVFLFILHCSFVKPLMEEKNSFCVVLENKLNMFMFG